MAERIASGEIYVEVNDRDAIARLEAVRAKYHSTLDSIDGEKAVAEIDASLKKFDRKIEEAHKKLADLDKEKATLDVDANIKKFEKTIDRAKAELEALGGDDAVVELDANAAKLKDQLKRARSELKQFGTEDAQAKMDLDDEEFQAARKRVQAEVARLDAEHADIEVKLKGYENLRKQISDAGKAIDDLNAKQIKNARERDKALQSIADAQMDRERAVAKAAEDADRDRAKAAKDLEADEKKIADEQIRRDVAELKRMRDSGKLRDKLDRDRDAMFGRDERRAREEQNSLGGLMGQYGLLISRLKAIDDARAASIGDHNKTIALDEKEIKTKRTLAQVTQRIKDIQKVKSDDERDAAARAKELEQVPQLESAYARLNNQLEDLRKKKMSTRDARVKYTIEIDERNVRSQMSRVGNDIRRITGHDPVRFEVAPTISERAGTAFRNEFRRASGNPLIAVAGMMVRTAELAGENSSRAFNRRFSGGIRNGLKTGVADIGTALGRGADRVVDKMARIGNSISDATIRLGPFTTTVRKAVVGLALFGPIIVDLVGALGSLVAVTGSAVVGLGALGVAAAGGFVPQLLGMGLVMKDVVQQFGAVKAAQKSYDDAVAKNGANSKQAAEKMKELQNVLKSVPPNARSVILAAQDIGKAWDKATKPGRASIWKAASEGLKTASALLPMFAKNTNEALDSTQKGLSTWMRALRSEAGKNALNTMMDNANKSIGPLMRGLGDLAAYLGKVGAVASGSLPGLALTFNKWAAGLNASADGSSRFVDGINNVIDSAKSVGRWFMAAGRLMKAFFSTGVKSGRDFADDMTQSMNKWTAEIEGDPGKFQHFWSESIKGAKQFFAALAPIAASFVSWSTTIAPIARGFFSGAAAAGRFLEAIIKLTDSQGEVAALAATLGSLWALGKLGSGIRMIQGFVKGLIGLTPAGRAAAAASEQAAAGQNALAGATARADEALTVETAALMRNTEALIANGAAAARSAEAGAASRVLGPNGLPIGGVARGARVAEGAVAAEGAAVAATRAAGPMARLAAVGGRAMSALSGLTMAAVGLEAPVVLGAAAVAGLGYGIYKLATHVPASTKALQAAAKASEDYQVAQSKVGRDLPGIINQVDSYKQANRDNISAQAQVNKLYKEGKTSGDAYKDALLRLNATTAARKQQRADLTAQEVKAGKTNETALAAARNTLALDQKSINKNKEQVSLGKQLIAGAKAQGQSVADYAAAQKKAYPYAADTVDKALQGVTALSKLTADQKIYNAAQDKNFLGTLNITRATQRMVPINEAAAKSFGALARAGLGGATLASTIANKYADAGKAAKVAASAAGAVKSGVSVQRVQVTVNGAKNAEDAIRKLNALELHEKLMKVKVNNLDQALGALKGLNDQKLVNKVVKILADSSTADSAVHKLIALGIPSKIARILGNNKDAVTKAAVANAAIQGVKGKTVAVTANVNGVSAVQGLISAIAGVVGKTVTVATNIVKRVIGGGKNATGIGMNAAGSHAKHETGVVETPATQNSQMRAIDKLQRGAIPRMSTTQASMGGRFQGPRAVWGEEPQYHETVISENPAYRKRNVGFLKGVAKRFGLAMNAAGTSSAAKKRAAALKVGATDAQKTKATDQARAQFGTKGKIKPIQYSSDNLTQMPKVAAAQRTENNLRDQLSNEASKLDAQEPDTFLYDTGKKSPNGDPIMAVDDGAIAAWNKKLADFAARVQTLVVAIQATLKAVTDAMAEIGDPKSLSGGVIGASEKNIQSLKHLINSETAKKPKSKRGKDMIAARVKWYKDQLSDQQSVQKAAISDWGGLDDERNDIGDATTRGRLYDATDMKNTYLADAGLSPDGVTPSSTPSKASSAASDAVASDPGASYTPPAAEVLTPSASLSKSDNAALASLDTESDLASVGMSQNGGPPRSADAITADKLTAAKKLVADATATLNNPNSTEDDKNQARTDISTGTGIISSITGNTASTAADNQSNFDSASSQLKDLHTQFASNLFSTGDTVAGIMQNSTNVRRGGSGGTGKGDTYITIPQTFPTQPDDPHLWSKQTAFELSAAL